MSQRKAKEYRRAMEQYQGVAADVDDLKRRIGAMEARHRREDRDKVEEIRRRLGFTSLRYHRLDDLVESVGISPCKLCTYCWNGKG